MILSRFRFYYLMILPWLGYLAMAITGAGHGFALSITSWLMLVIYHMFIYSNFDSSVPVNARQIASTFLPPLILLAGQFFRVEGSIWVFFIEDTMTELGAVNLALVVFMSKKMVGEIRSGNRDYGVAVPGFLILLAFTGVIMYSFVTAWIELTPGRNEITFANLAAAVIAAVVSFFKMFSQDGLTIDKGDKIMGLIIAEIFIWIFSINIIQAIIH